MRTRTAAVVTGTLALAGGLVGAAPAFADAEAGGAAVGSPGIVSGDVIQIPIQIPINLCGNSIDLIGLLNPTFGNTCVNADD